jgi:phosphosulfolactate synthase
MATSDVIREMKDCLDAGAFMVIYEYTEVVSLLAEDGGLERFLEVVASVGADKIMFEVPTNIVPTWRDLSRYATLYIEHIGPNVNIGDVHPSHVLTLETMRLGLTSRSKDHEASA